MVQNIFLHLNCFTTPLERDSCTIDENVNISFGESIDS